MEICGTIVIEVQYGEILRCFSANVVDLSIGVLTEKILALFKFGPDEEMILTFTDKDGDSVVVADDEDLLTEMVKQQHSPNHPLRINVKLNNGKARNFLSPSPAGRFGDTYQPHIHSMDNRGGGKVGRRAVEQNYGSALATLVLHLGSCHSLANTGQQEPLRTLLVAFNAFCECVGDLEMGKILARNREQNEEEAWIGLIGDLAGCISIKRPKEVSAICLILSKSLDQPYMYLREAAAAALSEFVRFSDCIGSILEQMVEGLCRHVSDDSPTVRRLCLRGLVQMPPVRVVQYTTQILSVIVALLDDPDESVQLTAVSCLLTVLGSSSNDAVDPVLLNLSVRLRNLQICMNAKIRANAFSALGALSSYGSGTQHDAFLEQVHAAFPRLVLHLHDDDLGVRQACRNTFKSIVPLLEFDDMAALVNTHRFSSDHRSDYEDFLRDLAKQFTQHMPSWVDTYMASIIQAFEAPWPVIQANAIYLCSSVISVSNDQHIFALYHNQVFGILVGKISRSSDAIVRATCSLALGLLLKSTNPSSWKVDRLDSGSSIQAGSESDSSRRT